MAVHHYNCHLFSSLISICAKIVDGQLRLLGLYQLWLGVALIFVVIMSGVFQYYQDSKSSKIMKAFESLVPRVSVVSITAQLSI